MWYLKQGEGHPRPIITPKRCISIMFIQRQIGSYTFMISKMFVSAEQGEVFFLCESEELLSNHSVLALYLIETFASLRKETNDYFIRKKY